MSPRRGRWRPVKDAIWLLIAITTVSMVITVRLGDGIAWLGSTHQTKDIQEGSAQNEHSTPERLIANVRNFTSPEKKYHGNNDGSLDFKNKIVPYDLIEPSISNNIFSTPTITDYINEKIGNPKDRVGKSWKSWNTNEKRNETVSQILLASQIEIRSKSKATELVKALDLKKRTGPGSQVTYQLTNNVGNSAGLPGRVLTSNKTDVITSRVYEVRNGHQALPLSEKRAAETRTAGRQLGNEERIDVRIMSLSSREKEQEEIQKDIDLREGTQLLGHNDQSKRGENEDSVEIAKQSQTEGAVKHIIREAAGRLRSESGSYSNTVTAGRPDTKRSQISSKTLSRLLFQSQGGDGASSNYFNSSNTNERNHVEEDEMSLDYRTIIENYKSILKHVNNVKTIRPGIGSTPHVLVHGPLTSVRHRLPLIEPAFKKHKAQVSFYTTGESAVQNGQWSIVMCLNSTAEREDCVVTTQGAPPHKVNKITALEKVLASPKLLCAPDHQEKVNTSEDTREAYGKWCGGDLPCTTLPQTQSSRSLDDSAAVGVTWCKTGHSGVWLDAGGPGSNPNSGFIACRDGEWQDELTRHTIEQIRQESVLIALPESMLTLDGTKPLVWQFRVLVTSLQPLRIYVHPSSLAWEGLQAVGDSQNPQHKKPVTLKDLRELLSDIRSEQEATLTLRETTHAIEKLARLTVERGFQVHSHKYSPQGFQLFDIMMVFNATLHPFILQVSESTYIEGIASLGEYLVEQNILEDLAPLILSNGETESDVSYILALLGFQKDQNAKLCNHHNDICLSEQDIQYLTDTRREQIASRNWIRIVPNSLDECSSLQVGNLSSQTDCNISTIEALALTVELMMLCPHKCNNYTHLHARYGLSQELGDVFLPASETLYSTQPLSCDQDPALKPYLLSIRSRPYIQLHPEFSQSNTEYEAWVDYNEILIHLEGIPANCHVIVRLPDVEEKNGSYGAGNLSLGLGENIIHLLLEDTEGGEPVTVATYTITIHRAQAGLMRGVATNDRQDQDAFVCALKQDCSLRYLSNEECGLVPWRGDQVVGDVDSYKYTWNQFLTSWAELPECGSQNNNDSRWLVPCGQCDNVATCYWSDAIWHQSGCREPSLTRTQLQECLDGKEVLFIGDSTNRGILYHLIERLNGSLHDWDKTHTMRVWSGLNSGRTMLGFAYYPQFWLDSFHRPTIDLAFSRLRNKSQAETRHKETVLVVGGVHWLNSHHLKALQERMSRDGLSNVKVIVKSHGAGFHQPVTGTHHLSLKDQEKLHLKNQALLRFARTQGYQTVDTFSMTMARFRDFRQGKCACHYHTVSPVHQSVQSKIFPGSSKHFSPVSFQYRVRGEINTAYSEMVINRICHR